MKALTLSERKLCSFEIWPNFHGKIANFADFCWRQRFSMQIFEFFLLESESTYEELFWYEISAF